MQPTDPAQVVPERGHGGADEFDDVPDDEVTRIIRRHAPRHAAAAPALTASNRLELPGEIGETDGLELPELPQVPELSHVPELPDDDDTRSEHRDSDERTRIVARTADDNTRIGARRQLGNRPAVHSEPDSDNAPAGSDPTDEATVRSSQRSKADDTLLSSRRAAAPAHPPVVDALQRRYEPPQVQSGASVRYSARPIPAVVEPKASAPVPVPDVQSDPARIRLADAATEIRERAAATARRRRRFTLVAIISSTVLVVLAAAVFVVFTVLTW
ncbi:MAG: hypothetical protein LH475_03055 [Cryobacterium sp.]|uniref:hypothetical protein n=1 Tax=Cryobacterium sp. TaxID=1926290 RepID=UPI00229BCB00|nr:hypothetical protein [Cryobacterium sp.]MCY7403606.1 hypothetical protein [Cryobacterium sp.]